VGSPRVTDFPELGTVLNTPTDNGDGVNSVQVTRSILIDTTSVVIKILRHGNTAGNGTTSMDFLHHVLLTLKMTILISMVHVVVLRDVASFTREAVSAFLHSRALLTIVVTSGSVDGAGLISDLVLRHPLEGLVVRTTVATIVLILTGDENLRSDVDIRPGSLAHDLNSIRHGRGCGMSPTGTTVLGNVLIAHVSKVVDTINIIPDELFW